MAVSPDGTATAGTDVSWPDFEDFREELHRYSSAFIADHIIGTTLSIGDRSGPRPLAASCRRTISTRSAFIPILGRGFEPAEEIGRNAHPVTVISYQVWKDRFTGDPEIVGKTQMLNGMPHTIIGVAPEGFYGTFVGWAMQFWVPLSMQEKFDPGGYKLEDRGARWIEGFVRLKPGVTTRAGAGGDFGCGQAAGNRLSSDESRVAASICSRCGRLRSTTRGTLLPTLGSRWRGGCFVLLIACANVGNLLLVRAFGAAA